VFSCGILRAHHGAGSRAAPLPHGAAIPACYGRAMAGLTGMDTLDLSSRGDGDLRSRRLRRETTATKARDNFVWQVNPFP
jgi:hypothetical protein